MRKDSSVIFVPRDSVFYGWGSSNIAFGFGGDLGNNTYVLNSATPVNVSNLTPNTTYHIAIFEFNGNAWANNYLTTSAPTTSFKTTDNTPTIEASNLSVSSITSTSAVANCNSGNGSSRLFVIRAGSPIVDNPVNGANYVASQYFGSGSNIGNNTYVLAHQQPASISNLLPGTTYYVKVFEYNGSGVSSGYMITNSPTTNFTTTGGTISEPTQQANNITASSISSNSATINCTAGNGQNRLVVIRQSSSISAFPIDGTPYNANTTFGSGSDLGNQTYVISNTSTPVTVTGLTVNSDFTVSIFEFNGSGTNSNYLSVNSSSITFHTLAQQPTTQASNVTITNITENSAIVNCTAGNGQNRLVVIKAGTTLTAQPNDGASYNANTVFGSGSDVGNQTYVISNTNTPVTVTGLTANSEFTISMFEFNGSGTTSNYLSVSNSLVTFHTLAQQPIVQASNVTITNITHNSATINCTIGNGQNRLIVVKAGSTVSAQPNDGTSYNSNTIFGSGSNIGDQTYVVSNSTSPVTITALSPNTDYAVSVFEFNGTTTSINYLTSNFPTTNFRTTFVTGIVDLGLGGTELKISPNPIYDNNLNLYFKTTRPGKFTLEIFSISGAKIFTKSWQMANGVNNHSVFLPSKIAGQNLLVNCIFEGKNGTILLFKK